MMELQNLTKNEAEAVARLLRQEFPKGRGFSTFKASDDVDGYGVRMWRGRSSAHLRSFAQGVVAAINAARLMAVTNEHAAIMARLDEHAKAINRQTEVLSRLVG